MLDDAGELAPKRGPALELALFLGSLVSWVSSRAGQDSTRTNVPCRRRPRAGRCGVEIEAVVDPDSGHILWTCPCCGDNGLIHGWQHTHWDRRDTTDPRFPTRPDRCAPSSPRS